MLCQAWEAAAQPAVDAGIRVVHLRFGVVLSGKGGALARMLPIFRAGLGGRLGSGQQWMSWIGLTDVTRVIDFAIADENLSGVVNAVAPNPVTNRAFTHTMGSVLGRPTLIPVPALALELAFGEMARATLLASQRAIPRRLTDEGFTFEAPDLESSLHLELNTRTLTNGSRLRKRMKN
jgi:uncharacterized protein (TIGR01777 family)